MSDSFLNYQPVSSYDFDSGLDFIATKNFESLIASEQFFDLLEALADEIRTMSISALNEATVVSRFEGSLYYFLRRFGINFHPDKEVIIDTHRHTSIGRLDSQVGALIIEYKHHAKLRTESDKARAGAQIDAYLRSLRGDCTNGIIGIITDGVQAQIIEIDENDLLSISPFEQLGGHHLEKILASAVCIQQTALTASNLVKDFCSKKNHISFQLARVLFDAMYKSIMPRSLMLFNEWKSLFHLAHDDTSQQRVIKERRESIERIFSIQITDPDRDQLEYKALFCLQTAYAIIIKSVALKVISTVRMHNSLISFERLSKSDTEVIRSQMTRVEEGDIFREIGFGNLLEGDFFAWYCTEQQWNDNISDAIKKVFSILSRYESQPILGDDKLACDFFKDLYMEVMPDKVRHSLGEFYTPPWLADHTINRAVKFINKADWRGMDPCCGSGTFVTTLIRKKMEDTEGLPSSQRLEIILNNVKGVDLNPIAVLTARINYFINISPIVDVNDAFEIPIYLGDASYIPNNIIVDNIKCVEYQIGTLQGPIDIILPLSAIDDVVQFSRTMTSIELHIKNKDEDAVADMLINLCKMDDRSDYIVDQIRELSKVLVDLEKRDWNGIWARIITNFLTTANLGKFDLIVGNPPWIDWKNLPSNYRLRIKELCIDRRLFSGDTITGGINLNICALISNVVAENWLDNDGVLALLMPDALLVQKTYEGFRNFLIKENNRMYFQELDDWSASGSPFLPVTQPFLTYFISKNEVNYNDGVVVNRYIKKRNDKSSGIFPLSIYKSEPAFDCVKHLFDINRQMAFTTNNISSGFCILNDKEESLYLRRIVGDCSYRAREGLEFYPQEVFLLHYDDRVAKNGHIWVRNYQGVKSKHPVPQQSRMLETQYLHPLVKGTDISRFKLTSSKFVVPFPYEQMSRSPIPRRTLASKCQNLMKYFNDHQAVLSAQTAYNHKIIGKKHNTEFYAIARVGTYTYGEHFVAFRDNTKWGAVVVSDLRTPWGEIKRPVFQNHAVAISQDVDGRYISIQEAHFICAILNTPMVGKYILSSSDSRTFKIQPHIRIPLYDESNLLHAILVDTSKFAHANVSDPSAMHIADTRLDRVYAMLLAELAA